jgi:hypothetical protein
MSAVSSEESIETGAPESARGWAPRKHRLRTSDGTGDGGEADWQVAVLPRPGQIVRRVWMDGKEWFPNRREWCPEMTIWPAWSPSLPDEAAATPLQGVHDYWSASGDRLRDSAKWMAAVIGASLAALVGTSPLAGMREHFSAATVSLGGAGILLLGITLFLVLQVMRPQSVSYTDVQTSGHGPWWKSIVHAKRPLRKWKAIVEAQQDLYLPCGVKCLTSLRQSMIIEEVTLIALAHAAATVGDDVEAGRVRQAQVVRSARLRELRDAAARVATIGEFYRVRYRSTQATYCGLPCGLLGTMAVVLAFAWPQL